VVASLVCQLLRQDIRKDIFRKEVSENVDWLKHILWPPSFKLQHNGQRVTREINFITNTFSEPLHAKHVDGKGAGRDLLVYFFQSI